MTSRVLPNLLGLPVPNHDSKGRQPTLSILLLSSTKVADVWLGCSKRHSEYFDPCQEAASRSLRCLHRNGGDRDLCADYFQYA